MIITLFETIHRKPFAMILRIARPACNPTSQEAMLVLFQSRNLEGGTKTDPTTLLVRHPLGQDRYRAESRLRNQCPVRSVPAENAVREGTIDLQASRLTLSSPIALTERQKYALSGRHSRS